METTEETTILDEMSVSVLKSMVEVVDTEPTFIASRAKYIDRLEILSNVTISEWRFKDMLQWMIGNTGWMLESVRLAYSETDVYVRGFTFVRNHTTLG